VSVSKFITFVFLVYITLYIIHCLYTKRIWEIYYKMENAEEKASFSIVKDVRGKGIIFITSS